MMGLAAFELFTEYIQVLQTARTIKQGATRESERYKYEATGQLRYNCHI